MQRIQFYPSNQLATKLNMEASNSGVSVSQYVTDLLEDYFGISTSEEPTITQLTATVLKEVEDFISQSNTGISFDLLCASETYQNISMVKGKRPSTVRASIGRAFAGKIGTVPFTNVRKYEVNGKQILSDNNTLMYEIF